MTEIRYDPVGRYSVVIAPERRKRPQDNFKDNEKNLDQCPFCPGNEHQTPPETFSNGNGLKKWTIRAVPNKYPAFTLSDKSHISGIQEVIVETDKHNLNMWDFSLDHMVEVLQTYKRRFENIKENKNIKYIVVFKNHGFMAGATLTHQHSQIVGLSFVPDEIKSKWHSLSSYYNENDQCLFCVSDKENDIYENDSFRLISPKAARFSYECWIIPKSHQSHYEKITEIQLTDLAKIVIKHLRFLNTELTNPAFNIIIHSGLYNEVQSEMYHWYMQIMPRTSFLAGFEWATGMFINQVEPENVTHHLKNELYNYKEGI